LGSRGRPLGRRYLDRQRHDVAMTVIESSHPHAVVRDPERTAGEGGDAPGILQLHVWCLGGSGSVRGHVGLLVSNIILVRASEARHTGEGCDDEWRDQMTLECVHFAFPLSLIVSTTCCGHYRTHPMPSMLRETAAAVSTTSRNNGSKMWCSQRG